MKDKIAIEYQAVYSACAEMCAELEETYAGVETEYAHLEHCAQALDGRANLELCQAMMANRKKAQVTCQALTRLYKFMELSARQVEEDEKILKASYTLGQSTGGAV